MRGSLQPQYGILRQSISCGKAYQFTYLPFGLTSAPRTFTMVLKPIAGILRKMGFRIRHSNPELHSRESRISDKPGKIHFHPCAGHRIPGNPRRLHKHEVSPPRIKRCCNSERMSPSGKPSSCFIEPTFAYNREVDFLQNCGSPSPPLYYRGIQHLKSNKPLTQLNNNVGIALDHHALEDLRWWADNLPLANRRPIRNSLPHLVIQLHASNSGWGAVSNGVDTRGTWTQEEASLHINCKELLAVSFAVKAFTKNLQNVHVLIQIDNATTIAHVNKMRGAKKCLLDHYERHLWSWCLEKRINPRAEHIPGCLNTIAARESRAKLDTSDCHLNQNVFQTLTNRLGQCTIDLFASRTNHQLPRFCSNKPDPEAEAIDVLTQPWAIEIGHAYPPFTLIAKCLRKERQE